MNSAPHIPGKTLPGRPSSFSKGINAFTKLYALSLILLLSTLALSSGEEAEQLSDRARMRQQNLNTVTNSWKANLDRAANDANLFVRRGLTANIAERKVEILGEATSLGKNAVTEFFIVAEHSSHDYEALITSFALPSDIEAALIQLNMQPGLSTDHKNLRFASKEPL